MKRNVSIKLTVDKDRPNKRGLLQEYTNAQIGSFLYRNYTQNFVYSEKGELFQIALTAKGGGLCAVKIGQTTQL